MVTLIGVALTAASLFSLYRVNEFFMVEIPRRGGTLTEGLVGLPRFVNPLLATSETDRDMTALVYSGLMKASPEGGLIPDLAESYSISDDGLTYGFILKEKAEFHDGSPVTADDVVFTIEKAQDPNLKSPRRPNWEGVKVKKISEREISLQLKQPYAPLLENATLGILPKHIWSGVDDEEFQFSGFNVIPVGSGPYKIKSMERNPSGIPTLYRLAAFDRYPLRRPFIKNLVMRFFSNVTALREAYKNGSVESLSSISPAEAESIASAGGRIEQTSLPRVFAVFFNQNQAPLFANREVRLALTEATDKEAIVQSVLGGYGAALEGPIPKGLVPEEATAAPESAGKPEGESERIAAAKKILESAKWQWNADKKLYEKKNKKETFALAFSISTSNAPELQAAAMMLQDMWQKIGAKVEVKIFDIGELNQNVIRTRKYDTLLFGEIIGRDLDLFAFWDSSQRNDPGLNVALYTNGKADKLLEEGRTLTDSAKRFEKYREFEAEVKKDAPAVFLYSPNFLYAVPKNLQGFRLGKITSASERFLSIPEWYLETEKVWKIFAVIKK